MSLTVRCFFVAKRRQVPAVPWDRADTLGTMRSGRPEAGDGDDAQCPMPDAVPTAIGVDDKMKCSAQVHELESKRGRHRPRLAAGCGHGPRGALSQQRQGHVGNYLQLPAECSPPRRLPSGAQDGDGHRGGGAQEFPGRLTVDAPDLPRRDQKHARGPSRDQ